MRLKNRLIPFLHLAVIFSFLTAAAPASIPSSSHPQTTAKTFDVNISLHNSPKTDAERKPYEEIIRYFADGVYESSNGAHKVATVKIYSGGKYADKADVVWVATCHPNAQVSGRAVEGQHVNFCDKFDTTDFLVDDNGWQGGGYTLAHEWGHYFYGLYDEYQGTASYDSIFSFPHSTDDAVPDSIMNSQWNARGGVFKWLNFSTADTNTSNTAQHRVYGASGWETLARDVSEDPRDGDRAAQPARIHYPELSGVAPAAGAAPNVDLPGTARSDLKIIWVSDEIAMQIVIDQSGSMDSENKMANAKAAAKLLIDLAEINKSTIGVIMFDDAVAVVQPLTLIDSQATKDAIKAQIDTIQPDGYTAIGDAAQKALDDLLATDTKDAQRFVYLLTDGQNNEGVDPLSVLPAYKTAKIPLFTFGYGSDVEPNTLQTMAQETGGKYYFSPTSLVQLTAVFQDAQQQVSPSVGISAGSASVQPGSPSAFPIQVDSTLSSLDLVVTYPGSASSVNLALVDPNGGSPVQPSCSDTGTESLCIFSVEAPQAGNWSLNADAQTSAVAVSYRASGSGENVITYAASVTSLTGAVVDYPDPIVLLAVLGREWPISGAVVNASIEAPDGTTTTFPMRDDGVAPDARANDGQYSAILDYTQAGAYNVSVQFDNSASSAQLTELSFQPSAGPNGEAFPLSAPILIAESFQRFARTQITVANLLADDHANSSSGATLLPAANVAVSGRIDYAGDVDVFVLGASPSGQTVVRVSNLALGMNPRLRVLASDGTTLLQEADRTNASSTSGYLVVTLNVSPGDTVYAEVSHLGQEVGGRYEISAGPAIYGDGAGGGQPPLQVTPVTGAGGGGGSGLGIALILIVLAVGGVFIYVASIRNRPGAPGVAAPAARVDVISGPLAGQSIPILGGRIIIGRGSRATLNIPERSVSRTHAQIAYAQGKWYLQDLGSSSGTILNGQRIGAGQLRAGDQIIIGSTTLVFRV